MALVISWGGRCLWCLLDLREGGAYGVGYFLGRAVLMVLVISWEGRCLWCWLCLMEEGAYGVSYISLGKCGFVP